eukprot:jgi/Antlo1/2405/1197
MAEDGVAFCEMSEIYTVDLHSGDGLIIYGGKNDSWAVLSVETGDIIFYRDQYSDSVIFVRFVSDGIIVATLDGCIYKYNRDFSEKCKIELEQDISFIDIKENMLYTATDVVYLFNLDLVLHTTLCQHPSGVTHVALEKSTLYTISERLIQISCCKNESPIYNIWINSGGPMCVSVNGLLCAQTDARKLSIFLGNKLLKKVDLDDNAEAIVCFHSSFLVGGHFNYLLIVSTSTGFCMRKIQFYEDVGGVSKIHITENGAIFSTFDSKIGIFRMESGVVFFDTTVGIVFDFCMDNKFLLLGGECGVCLMQIQDLLLTERQSNSSQDAPKEQA